VYVRPLAGTTRFELVCSKLYGEENNNVYDNEGAAVSSVGNSTGSEAGITSIDGAEHFVNFEQANEYATKIRIKYVMRVRMSQYDAMMMYYQNGNKDNSMLRDLITETENTETAPNTNPTYKYIKYPDSINKDWDQRITSSDVHTYEYTKVIPALEKLTDTDWANLQSIFANADRNNSGMVVGEVYVGTNSNTIINLFGTNASRDISDYITWEKFVADYVEVKENKTQVESCGLGQHLKIIDNNNDGVAEYVLKTVYTVAIVASNGTSLDVSGVRLVDSKVRDEVNSTALTTPFFSTEGLAAGDVVVYALIDGKIHATKAEGETVKINTVNRAGKTATATGEDGKTWSESDVHTHSNGLNSGVTGMVGNTTYSIYFDLYGNLAAYTEGTNGSLVLITNGWYNNTISGPEYAIQAYVDGSLQTVTVGANGGLFIGNNASSNNTWNQLKTTFGHSSINSGNTNKNNVQTIVANLDGNVLTPVDKTYLYSQQLRMLDMKNNVIPGRDNFSTSLGYVYSTEYVDGTAYMRRGSDNNNAPAAANEAVEVRALSNTVYYTVYKDVGIDNTTGRSNVVVRSYTGYNNVPSINRSYIEDVYAVGARATATTQTGGVPYYVAQVVVIELNDKYNHMADSEQVFVPEFTQVTNNIGIEDVTMVRGNGELVTVQVDMTQSNTSDYYDNAGDTTRKYRVPGLYFMDPSDSNPNVFVIQRMNPGDVRANNYLAGYVRQSWSVLSNNYAQVEMKARPMVDGVYKYETSFGAYNVDPTHPDFVKAQNTRPVDPNVSQVNQAKAVTEASKMYTFGGTLASFKESTAAEVLNQSRAGQACGTTTTDVSGLNERWDGVASTGLNFPNYDRNEVLVRYDAAGNVIWAVSFNETKSAQQVWWNYLLSTNDVTTINFWGNEVPANRQLTIDFNQAKASEPVVDLSALRASIASYSLYKWNFTTNTWDRLSDELEDSQTPSASTEQRYRLEVHLNTGDIQEYYLTQLPQNTTGALSHTTPSKIKVLKNGTLYGSLAEAQAAAAANRTTIWVDDPAHTDIAQLENPNKSGINYLTFTADNGKTAKSIVVEYVDNGKGSIVEKDKTIADAITFDDGTHKQTLGLIVLKVTNYDDVVYYIPLTFETDDANYTETLAEAQANAKAAVDSWVKYCLDKKNLTEEILNANIGNPDAGIMNGNPTNWKAADKIAWLKKLIDETTVPADANDLFSYDASRDPKWVGKYYPTSGEEKYVVLGNSGNIKDDIQNAINALSTGVTGAQNAASAEIQALANKNMTDANRAQLEAARDAGLKAIAEATTVEGIATAKAAALKAIRNIIAPAAAQATPDQITEALKDEPVFNGISDKLWAPDQIVQDGATLKISGTVFTSYDSTNWSNIPGMGTWAENKALMDAKFPGANLNNTKGVVIAIATAEGVQLISIGDANATYAQRNPGATYTVVLPNAPEAFAFDLDLSGVTFK
ncbi:MAG: hypothetical protein HFF66_12145, partial [Oscillospiraceae bacterium]|nr:hypothetical protein [Oscillospiraceae bacterium]